MGGLGGKGDERSSESGFSDDLFVFVGFVGEAHATGCVVAVWGESRRDETFAKFLFPRQPKPKQRFSAVFVSNIH